MKGKGLCQRGSAHVLWDGVIFDREIWTIKTPLSWSSVSSSEDKCFIINISVPVELCAKSDMIFLAISACQEESEKVSHTALGLAGWWEPWVWICMSHMWWAEQSRETGTFLLFSLFIHFNPWPESQNSCKVVVSEFTSLLPTLSTFQKHRDDAPVYF